MGIAHLEYVRKTSSQCQGESQQVQLMLHHLLTLKEQIHLMDAPGHKGKV